MGLRPTIAMTIVLALGVGSEARAQKWQRMGPEGGMVVSLGAGKADEVYLGTADGHVFASSDRTQSWELRGRVGTRSDGVITRIVVDSRKGKRLLAAVWYRQAGAGGGVFESEDRGRNWQLVGMEKEAVRALEIAPSQPDELVAGTRSGVFRSVDGGKNWTRISPEGDEEIRNLDSLAIDPRDPNVIYAGTYHLPWLTRDGGKTWKPAVTGIIDDSDIMSLRLDATNPERVYMSACSGIYRSENQGGEWTKLQGIPYAARRTQVITQDPGNAKTLYAGTTEGLWVTRDAGESWVRITSKDWVVNSVVVLGSKDGGPERVVLGTEGRGVEVSDDGGVTFAEANRGFTHVIVKELVADANHAEHSLMVVERSASEILESQDDGNTWTKVALGAVERGRPKMLNGSQVREVLASPWGWLLRLDDGKIWKWEETKKTWREWKLLLAAPMQRSKTGAARATKSEVARQLTPGAAIAFSSNEAVVSTNEGLVRCRDTGRCARMKAFNNSGKAQAVWVSTGGAEIVAVMDGKLGSSDDGGETAIWRDLPVPAEHVLRADAADNHSVKTIYLATTEGIFFAQGRPGSTWKRVSGGLPAGWVEVWLRRQHVWAVSERNAGLYISQDEGGTWKRADTEAERGRFTGLLETASGMLLAGSQSEGLLRLELGNGEKR